MSLKLSYAERTWLNDDTAPGRAMAMRLVVRAAEFLGAERMVPIVSAHIDGCLYHGDGGVKFVERLRERNATVSVPSTMNVGALDLGNEDRVRADAHFKAMARRQMNAYLDLGCQPSWTCAPYQAGHRPSRGEQVAWGESNAVAFVNSVLGARTERYGDLLDICCAITGRAPFIGLHRDEGRWAKMLIDVTGLSSRLKAMDAFYPALGAILGAAAGTSVAVIDGLPTDISEDNLKALGAAAASKGAVGLFHVAGRTSEAPDVDAVLGDQRPVEVITITAADIRAARDSLSNTHAAHLNCLALGSPHFSEAETRRLAALADGRVFQIPVYICTGRHTMDAIDEDGTRAQLEAQGVEFIVDTCVVVTPILKDLGGVLMTNSGKFAHYATPNTGYDVVFGSLEDCVRSGISGRVERAEAAWR